MITSKVRPEGTALRAAGLPVWVWRPIRRAQHCALTVRLAASGPGMRPHRDAARDSDASGCLWARRSKARASSGCKCCWPVSVVPGSLSASARAGPPSKQATCF
jgi:hypothetical protein